MSFASRTGGVMLAASLPGTTSGADVVPFPNFAEAILTAYSDGRFWLDLVASGGGVYTTWLVAGSGSAFEIRFTLSSGTLTAGTAGVWLPLSSDQEWLVVRSSKGFKNATGTIEIRAAGNSQILTSTSVSLTAALT